MVKEVELKSLRSRAMLVPLSPLIARFYMVEGADHDLQYQSYRSRLRSTRPEGRQSQRMTQTLDSCAAGRDATFQNAVG